MDDYDFGDYDFGDNEHDLTDPVGGATGLYYKDYDFGYGDFDYGGSS